MISVLSYIINTLSNLLRFLKRSVLSTPLLMREGLGVGLLVLTSCSSYLDVKPYDQIAEDELLASQQGYEKLLNGIYLDLNNDALYGKSLTVEMVEVMGQVWQVGDNEETWGSYIDLWNHRYGTKYWRSRFDQTWNKAYALIANCNKILDHIDADKALFTGNRYNLIKGEALALRAYLHFDMLRLFGPVYIRNAKGRGIPYRLHQDLDVSPILDADSVMKLVIADLETSLNYLDDDPIRTKGTLMSPDNKTNDNFERYRAFRLNYFAVNALLARAYQWMWDPRKTDYSDVSEQDAQYREKALHYAEVVLQASRDGIFPMVDRSLVLGTPTNPDRIFSSEVVFGLNDEHRGELFDNYFDPSLAPSPVFTMDSLIVSKLIFDNYDAFWASTDDYRYVANWKQSGNRFYFYKYDDIRNTAAICNRMVPLIRLGEMYLIAAEAQTSREAGAAVINELRRYRGTGDIRATAYNRSRLAYEYIRETVGEGQVFFYRKRCFANMVYGLSTSLATLYTPADDAIYVVPLPDTEKDYR